MTFSFAHWWAFLALPLPLLAYLALPRAPALAGAALRVPFYALAMRGRVTQSARPAGLMLFLALLVWLLLVTAAARPQWIGDPLPLPLAGRDLMLAVDISGSMVEEDMVIGARVTDRLTAVKAVAGDFIERRAGDRIGLILFGQQAYLQAPLTFDRETVRTLLFESAIGLAGRETAIGDAIGLSVKRLRDQPAEQRVLILLTDGANTAGAISPDKAAELAAEAGVRIYTIGIGADPRGPFGMSLGRNPLDERTLKAIAKQTGGRYFRARDLRELQSIYALLDELEPVDTEEEGFRPVIELFAWPLGMALILSALAAAARLVGANIFAHES
ncbi:vWA domain-containing protein [Thiorhodovibrio frisius]|uniref:Mg-chelatase subunit ChlD n=1 Tax=Thiorhodovibrio frisius TaxID=631362 RepID=H8Z6I7_9GAMM|nr:VWA domain-containing protein [Thiorhodovibrio frisius]EIC19685.1 Mg-chelatase subunit ChlD [Thiorhodovibrio frisius]WPL20347.1 VWFA-related Acidobacterial domain protein [Thiorhodovibrio frisius]